MSEVTQHVNLTPLTVEDRLLIKTSQTEKSWSVESRDSGNGIMLFEFDLLRIMSLQ